MGHDPKMYLGNLDNNTKYRLKNYDDTSSVFVRLLSKVHEPGLSTHPQMCYLVLKNYICYAIDENVMVKVKSPLFSRMKGKIGQVHFQTQGGQIRMHHILKIRPGPTHAQLEHRNRFKWAIKRYRNLLPSERENLKLWASRVLRTASGYDYWTKADLAAITFETLEDKEGSAPDKRYVMVLVKHPMLYHVKITNEEDTETYYDSASA